MMNGNENGGQVEQRSLSGALKAGRLSVVTVAVLFLMAASLVPVLLGTYRARTTPEISLASPVCVSGNTTCPNYSPEIVRLEQLLKASQDEATRLSQKVYTLQSQIVNLEEAPPCKVDANVEQLALELGQKQQYLLDTLEEVQGKIKETVQQNDAHFEEVRKRNEDSYERLTQLLTNATHEVHRINEDLAARSNETELLSTLAALAVEIGSALQVVDSNHAKFENITEEVNRLRIIAENFTCPDSVIPAIVVPEVKMDCPTLPTPVVVAPPAPPSATTEGDAEQAEVPVRECVDMAAAKEIVTNMAFTELELLGQDLSRHCDASLQATMGAVLGATETTGRALLEEYLRESERLLAEHSEYIAETVAQAKEQTIADCRQAARDRTRCAQALSHGVHSDKHTSIGGAAPVASLSLVADEDKDEFDFASLSSGSRVIAAQTSHTYYPSEWTLPAQLRGALDRLGVASSAATASADAMSAALDLVGGGSGRQVYEALNLHKAIGAPEDALRSESQSAACWPMEGASGNLTIHMSGAVVINSVSIEHPNQLSAGPQSRSAPRQFEVYGIDGDNGVERLLVRGTYNHTLGAPSRQTFAVDSTHEVSDQPFEIVSLRVLSNYGHPHYTCLYRFRVHGAPLP